MTRIRTTVYDHKVIDVLDIRITPEKQEFFSLMGELADLIWESIESGNGGYIKVKTNRPLSQADRDHRLGVIAKNSRAAGKRGFKASERYEYEHYLRLKARFENG